MNKFIIRLLKFYTLVTSLSLTFVFFTPMLVIALFSRPRKRLYNTRHFWKLWGRWMLKYALLARVHRRNASTLGHLPSALYVANHQSYWDTPLITSLYPVRALIKRSIVFFPLFGQVALLCGGISVNRSSASSRQKAITTITKILHQGDSLLLFPEGTRSVDGFPRPFEKIKTSLIRIAYELKIPVIPLSIYGTRDLPSLPLHERLVSMISHKPVRPSDFSSSEEFSKACWGEVLRGCNQLQNEFSSYKTTLKTDRK